MSGTIRDAIHFWSEGTPDPEKMEQACRIAEVSGFLSQLPRGLDTKLGERGAGLSEGQLQRIALAVRFIPASRSCCWTKRPPLWTRRRKQRSWIICAAAMTGRLLL